MGAENVGGKKEKVEWKEDLEEFVDLNAVSKTNKNSEVT